MLIDADHRSWIVATLAAALAAGVVYVSYVAASPYGPSGGSWIGLGFGVLGTTAMVLAGLLAARKKVRLWRLGSARAWMQMHLWLGLLAVPLILFHAGFRLGGPLTTVLMAVFAIVIVSGMFGAAVQQFLPAAMTARVPLETVGGQIAYVAEGIAANAYELVASVVGELPEAAEERARLRTEEEAQRARPGNWKQITRLHPAVTPAPETTPLRQAYLEQIRPYLRRDRRRRVPLPDLRTLAVEAADEWRPKVDKLRELCEESRQLGVQERLHAWLHHWLFVHAPLSFALFALAAVHVVFALRY